jgi:hypothetical protein
MPRDDNGGVAGTRGRGENKKGPAARPRCGSKILDHDLA